MNGDYMWEDYLIKEWDMEKPINRRIRPILRQTLTNVWESIPIGKTYELDDPELFEMYKEEMFKLLKEKYEDLLSKNQIPISRNPPTNKPLNFKQWYRPITMYSKTKLPLVLNKMSTLYLESQGLVKRRKSDKKKQRLTRIDKISKMISMTENMGEELLKNIERIAKAKRPKKFAPWVDKLMSDGKERTVKMVKDGIFDLLERRIERGDARISRVKSTSIPEIRILSHYLKTEKDESGNKKYVVTNRSYPFKFKLNTDILKAVNIFPVAKKMINDLIDDHEWKSGERFNSIDYIDKFMNYLPDNLTPQQMREIKYFYKRTKFKGWFTRYLTATMKSRNIIDISKPTINNSYILKSSNRKKNRILQKRAVEEVIHEMEEGTEYHWQSIKDDVAKRMRELATKANIKQSVLSHYINNRLSGNLKQSLTILSVNSGWSDDPIRQRTGGSKLITLIKKNFNLKPFDYDKGEY